MKNPPKIIKLILKALCIILNVKPAGKKKGKILKMSHTAAAQGKELLGNP